MASGGDDIKSTLALLASSCLKLESTVAKLDANVSGLQKTTDELKADIRTLREDLIDRMTPDRCGHLHETLMRDADDRARVIAETTCKRYISQVKQQASLAWRIIRIVLWVAAALLTGFGGGTVATRLLSTPPAAQILLAPGKHIGPEIDKLSTHDLP